MTDVRAYLPWPRRMWSSRLWTTLGVAGLLAGALVGFSGCGPEQDQSRLDPAAQVVELSGADGQIDFDDIVYSERLRRVLVPARESGLYLVDPDSGDAQRLGRLPTADSADEGRGLVFVLRRDDRAIEVVDPDSGRVVASARATDGGDYVRYVAATDELWVTQPDASSPGIEIFALPEAATPTPRRTGFIEVPGGTEGITLSSTAKTVYTHAGNDLVTVDVRSRAVSAHWPTGCDGTHGFPRVDARDELVLASCADDGEVVLLDADNGRELGRYAVGGGEALPAYSADSDHFYVRSDPGTTLATLAASDDGLTLITRVQVPKTGHCLTADSVDHYWTCDANQGRVLRFADQ